MATNAGVLVNPSDLQKVRLALNEIKNGSDRVIMRAANRSMTESKTDMSRRVNKKVNLKIAQIKETIIVNKMKPKNLNGNWNSKGLPIPLFNYGARQTNKGVTVAVLRGGKRKLIKHYFIATMKSGKRNFIATMKSEHKGVFYREKKVDGIGRLKEGRRIALPSPQKETRRREIQLPIREAFGPRIQDVMDDSEVMNPAIDYAGERIVINMERETKFLLSKAA